MKRNYDLIAGFYDRLVRLVYGDKLVVAQQYLVSAIPAGARILIVGGGTGWVLEEIAKIHVTGLSITYVDASTKMIAQAQARTVGGNNVTFIWSAIEDFQTTEEYDVVLTPFLFDNFTEVDMRKIFERMDNRLAPGGIWLYCDFQNTHILWQKAMLKIMYLFFRASCGIEASALPGTGVCFADNNYTIRSRKTFLNGFIESMVYIKSGVDDKNRTDHHY